MNVLCMVKWRWYSVLYLILLRAVSLVQRKWETDIFVKYPHDEIVTLFNWQQSSKLHHFLLSFPTMFLMSLPNRSWKNKIKEMHWQLRLCILAHTFKPLSIGKTPQNIFFNFLVFFSFVFSPWAPPSLFWCFPWVAEWRLALVQLLTYYILVAEFSHSSAEHTCVRKCAARVHDWKQNSGFGDHNTHYGGCCYFPCPGWCLCDL